MFDAEQIAKTTQRYEERTSERAGTEAKLAAGAILEADEPERVRSRLIRKGIAPEMAAEVLSGDMSFAITETMSPRVLNTLERIIGKDNLINATFLTEGARACRAVCRVEIAEPNGLVAGYGTGVMVSSRLMLTNNHVLGSIAAAATSQAEFGYEDDDEGRVQPSVRFALEPDAFFVTDPELDYTLVAVSPTSADGQPLHDFGWMPLIEQQGKVIKGEYVNIIQHPNGDPKRLALRENQIVDLLDDFLHYKTDTAPGSSGSPVFNDEWEMVALHHSGVPAKDADGNFLDIDGGIWTEDMGEQRVKWVANEGARVSRLIGRLRKHDLTAAQRALLDAVFSGNESVAPAPSPASGEERRGIVLQRTPGDPTFVEAGAPIVSDGMVTWTIPIQVSVQVGAPVGAPVAATTALALSSSLTSVPAPIATPVTRGAGPERMSTSPIDSKPGGARPDDRQSADEADLAE